MALMLELAKATAREMSGKARVDEGKEWSWAPGMILFPETRCYFCKLVLKSKAIWKVDEKSKKLLGQGVPMQGEPLVMEEPYHPHASETDGRICMGSGDNHATEVTQALFYSYNPKSLLNGRAKLSVWFASKYWDHVCDQVVTCSRCQYETGKKESNLYKEKSYCDECGKYYIPQEIAKEKKKEEARVRKLEAQRAARAAKKAALQALKFIPQVTSTTQGGTTTTVTTYMVDDGETPIAEEPEIEEIEIELCDRCVEENCKCRACENCEEMTPPDDYRSCCDICANCHGDHDDDDDDE